MSKAKYAPLVVAIAGLGGALGMFLPAILVGDADSVSFWDFHQIPWEASVGFLSGHFAPYIALVAWGFATVIGLQATFGTARKAHGTSGIALFAFMFIFEIVRKGLLGYRHGSSSGIGGKLMFLSAFVGLVASIVLNVIAAPNKKQPAVTARGATIGL